MSFHVFMGLMIMALIYILIQWYLSLRPSFIWGLVLPAGFCALLFMSVLNKLPEIMGITYNDIAREIYTTFALAGIVVCALIYIPCRFMVKRRNAENRKLYEAYLAARERRAALERKIMGED